MSEKPIIYNGEMVRAILDGRKSQTRRVIKYADGNIPTLPDDVEDGWPVAYFEARDECDFLPCPYGQPGDRLWVREKHARKDRKVAYDADGLCGYMTPEGLMPHGRVLEAEGYAACFPASGRRTFGIRQYGGKWRPSIHMPRWASRITLGITGIRVERVRDITSADVMREGAPTCSHPSCTITGPPKGCDMQLCGFRQLWDSLNAKRGYGWDVNPWVWVIEFRRIDPQ